MHEPVSDLHRLFEELEFEWGLTDLTCDGHVLKVLQPIMRKGNWQVTVAIYQDKEIIAVSGPVFISGYLDLQWILDRRQLPLILLISQAEKRLLLRAA